MAVRFLLSTATIVSLASLAHDVAAQELLKKKSEPAPPSSKLEKPAPTSDAPQPEGTGPDAPVVAPKTNSSKPLDDELFNRLIGETPDEESGNDPDGDPLESAIRKMRAAKDRLAKRQTDDKTRQLQEQIVQDLEQLIKMAKQQNRRPPPSQRNPDRKQQPQQDEQKTQPGQQQNQVAQQSGSGNAGESDEQIRREEQRKAELARRSRLVKDVWGHLPERVRRELLNIASDNYLPKYEDLIRTYFEALAEQDQDKGNSR